MACGSGAFLVQACRYLSERLLEAWENEEKAKPGRPRIAPEGKRSAGDPTEKILEGVEDREVDARRLIAQRCLYGVDKNPRAYALPLPQDTIGTEDFLEEIGVQGGGE